MSAAVRIPGLDSLRGVAILLVLGRHLTPAPDTYALHDATRLWMQGGWVGVDLFFVLSGFLVSGLLFQEYLQTGTVAPGCFLIRRGFKIYPPFWALLGSTLAVATWQQSSVPPVRLLGELLFLQNYLGGLWDMTWSLAVEEHFYLILAGLIPVALRISGPEPLRKIPLLLVLFMVGCQTGRLLMWAYPYSHRTHLFPTHLRIDSLAFGVLLAYLWHYRGWRLHPRFVVPTALVGVILMMPPFIWPLDNAMAAFGTTSAYLGGGALVISASSGSWPTLGLGRIGRDSYSIYLWHLAVREWIAEPLSSERWAVYALIYLGGAILFGMGMAALIEQPALRLRDRLMPRLRQARVPSPLGCGHPLSNAPGAMAAERFSGTAHGGWRPKPPPNRAAE